MAVKFGVSMPEDIVGAIDKIADEWYTSRSGAIVRIFLEWNQSRFGPDASAVDESPVPEPEKAPVQ